MNRWFVPISFKKQNPWHLTCWLMVLEVAEILIVNYLYKVNDIGYIGICTLANHLWYAQHFYVYFITKRNTKKTKVQKCLPPQGPKAKKTHLKTINLKIPPSFDKSKMFCPLRGSSDFFKPPYADKLWSLPNYQVILKYQFLFKIPSHL